MAKLGWGYYTVEKHLSLIYRPWVSFLYCLSDQKALSSISDVCHEYRLGSGSTIQFLSFHSCLF